MNWNDALLPRTRRLKRPNRALGPFVALRPVRLRPEQPPPDEEERRGVSALLAVINSVREFGRAITAPLGAPAGIPMAYIEVPFTSGEKKLRPDGVVQVRRGSALWTVLIEVKTGANEPKAAQVESYLDVAREQGFNAVLTISNQLAGAPGEHPLTVDKRKLRKVSLHHLSWSQIRTEALVEQGNKAVSDPDQAWILAEFIRYLEHPRSGAAEFEDMGASQGSGVFRECRFCANRGLHVDLRDLHDQVACPRRSSRTRGARALFDPLPHLDEDGFTQ